MSEYGDKTFLLGIDSLDYKILFQLIKENCLPHFEKIAKEGTATSLRSTLPIHSAPAWTSITTGTKPEKHGIFYFKRVLKGEDENKEQLVSRFERQYPAVWNILSNNNLKSIIMNVPVTYPPEEINGIFLSGGVLTPTEREFIYPEALREKVLNSGYRFHIHDLSQIFYRPKLLLKEIRLVTTSRFNLAIEFLKNYEWDFFMLVLRSPDVLVHKLYPIMRDSTHPYFESVGRQMLGKIIEKLYIHLDNLLGDLIHHLEKNADTFNLVIASDHGCGTIHRYFHPVPLLRQLGFLEVKENVQNKLRQRRRNEYLKEKVYSLLSNFNLLSTAWKFFYRIRRRLGGASASSDASFLDEFEIGASEVIPFGYHTLLIRNTNKKKAKKIIRELKAILSTLTDQKNEESPIESIRVIPDPTTEKKGDWMMLLEMASTYEVNDEIRGRMFRNSLRGKHSKFGVCLGYGKDFNRKIEKKARCWDVTPTILDLMGLEPPKWMDGRSLLPSSE